MMKTWRFVKISNKQIISKQCFLMMKTILIIKVNVIETYGKLASFDLFNKRKCFFNLLVSFKISLMFVQTFLLSRASTILLFIPNIGCWTILWCHLKYKLKLKPTNLIKWTYLLKIKILILKLYKNLKNKKAKIVRSITLYKDKRVMIL